jgi:hypothetical protein
MTPEREFQAMVDRETAAWDRQDAEALVELFHPDMVWPPLLSAQSLAGLISVGQFPKLTWSADLDWQFDVRVQDVLVACDQRVGFADHGGSHDPFVIDVAQTKIKMSSGFGNDLMVAQKVFNIGHNPGRHVDPLEQRPLEFSQYNFSRDQIMLDEDVPQEVCTYSTARERADEHVGVEEYPHDTAEKTSSSVRRPRASANGRTLFRRRSKRSRDNCRRRASRARSLRVRPVCLARRARSRSSSSSSLRVNVPRFMCHNVTHSEPANKPLQHTAVAALVGAVSEGDLSGTALARTPSGEAAKSCTWMHGRVVQPHTLCEDQTCETNLGKHHGGLGCCWCVLARLGRVCVLPRASHAGAHGGLRQCR